jgi:hypothetical protein
MDFFKRLLGTDEQRPPERPLSPRGRGERSPDEQAIDRYRYLLRTAPPETIEEAHAEAFSKLTPEQRRMVLDELRASAPASERDSGVFSDDSPRALARTATRAEMRDPGALERTWSRMPAPAGLMGGGLMGGGLMSTFMGAFAGVMIGNMVADAFLGDMGYDAGAEGGDMSGDAGMDGAPADDPSGGGFEDAGGSGNFGDFGGFDDFGGDFGGDF